MPGGDISLVSQPGEGSVFTLTIATGAIDETTLINPSSNPTIVFAQDTTSSGVYLDGWVIVVDDQSHILILVKQFKTGAGANVVGAEDGEAAVMQVNNALAGKRTIPDLILLHMQTPRPDGYGTVEQLGKIGYQNPVIALTTNAMQSDLYRCPACGCDAYLSNLKETVKLAWDSTFLIEWTHCQGRYQALPEAGFHRHVAMPVDFASVSDLPNTRATIRP